MKHLGTKRIETERLVLRPFTIDDAPKMYENWASDCEVTKYLMWPTHSGVDVTQKILQEWVESYTQENKYEWCLELKETGEPIGSMGVVRIVEKAELMEIGYCISRTYWHQGITSEALQAVMDFLFDEVGVNRIESRHNLKNLHSGNVMKKCGMVYEGTKVEGDWDNSGICDIAFYGLTKTQRKNQKKSSIAAQQTKSGKNVISDETMEYVGILAKLELSDEEKEAAKKDMESMIDYIDKLNELDTSNVEPMSHVFPVKNVFREDVVENGDGGEDTLANAPERRDRAFVVPKTVDQ